MLKSKSLIESQNQLNVHLLHSEIFINYVLSSLKKDMVNTPEFSEEILKKIKFFEEILEKLQSIYNEIKDALDN